MTMARPGGSTQRIKEYLIAPAVDRQVWCVVDGKDGDVFWSADRATCVAWATGAGYVSVLKDVEIARLREALSFAASCIKSGESWTSTCEEMIGGALRGKAGA